MASTTALPTIDQIGADRDAWARVAARRDAIAAFHAGSAAAPAVVDRRPLTALEKYGSKSR